LHVETGPSLCEQKATADAPPEEELPEGEPAPGEEPLVPPPEEEPELPDPEEAAPEEELAPAPEEEPSEAGPDPPSILPPHAARTRVRVRKR
jgi:hypothetical protein